MAVPGSYFSFPLQGREPGAVLHMSVSGPQNVRYYVTTPRWGIGAGG